MTARSLTVDDAVIASTARDGTVLALTRGPMIAVWIIAGLALLIGLGSLLSPGGTSPVLIVVPLVLAVLMPLLLRRRLGIALRAATPPGTTLTVDVRDDGVHLETAQGVADVAFSAYRSVRVMRSTVLLAVRGSSVVTTLPRRLLDDTDLQRIRAAIGG